MVLQISEIIDMTNWDSLWLKEENIQALRGPSFRHKVRIVKRLIRTYAELREGVTILDVACGTGDFLNTVADIPASLNGIDSSAVAIERARKNCALCHFKVLDIEKNTPEGAFDIVTCMNALEEMKDDDSALSHIADSVRKNGYLIIVTPHSMKYWTKKDEDALNVRRYETDELIAKCEKAGFDPVTIYVWGWPLFDAYYRIMAGANQESMLKSRVRRYAVRLIQAFLYAAFFIDDFFASFGKGRILFAVFKKR